MLAFCDGINYELMLPVQDHKRLKDNDEGPNTGGMGAACPYKLSGEELAFIRREIFDKALEGMRTRSPYKGSIGVEMTNKAVPLVECFWLTPSLLS